MARNGLMDMWGQLWSDVVWIVVISHPETVGMMLWSVVKFDSGMK